MDMETNVAGRPVPELLTAPDEQRRCCVLDEAGERCPRATRYWVGTNGLDDYTHVCAEHLEDVLRAEDTVRDVDTWEIVTPSGG